MRRITVGAWRKTKSDPMEVVSGAMGKEKVHFVAPEGARVPREMEAFLAWFAKSDTMDPILRAGMSTVAMVSVAADAMIPAMAGHQGTPTNKEKTGEMPCEKIAPSTCRVATY